MSNTEEQWLDLIKEAYGLLYPGYKPEIHMLYSSIRPKTHCFSAEIKPFTDPSSQRKISVFGGSTTEILSKILSALVESLKTSSKQIEFNLENQKRFIENVEKREQ